MKNLLLATVLFAGCTDSIDQAELSSEIVGGTRTTAYAAVPYLYSEFAGSYAFCSGTLISPRVILTAAHCVEFTTPPQKHLAYFGSDTKADGVDDAQFVGTVPIVSYAIDPLRRPDDLYAGHDFALLLLGADAPVAPLPFRRTPIDDRTGAMLHLVGWGLTVAGGSDGEYKRETSLPISEITSTLVGYGTPAQGTCQGDSGGPQFLTIDGVETLVSVTSFGSTACDHSFGGRIDTAVTSFVDPFLAQYDPTPMPMPNGGDDDDSGPDQPSGEAPVVTGGCSTAGGSGAGLLLLALAFIRRRAR